MRDAMVAFANALAIKSREELRGGVCQGAQEIFRVLRLKPRLGNEAVCIGYDLLSQWVGCQKRIQLLHERTADRMTILPTQDFAT